MARNSTSSTTMASSAALSFTFPILLSPQAVVCPALYAPGDCTARVAQPTAPQQHAATSTSRIAPITVDPVPSLQSRAHPRMARVQRRSKPQPGANHPGAQRSRNCTEVPTVITAEHSATKNSIAFNSAHWSGSRCRIARRGARAGATGAGPVEGFACRRPADPQQQQAPT